MAVGVDAGEEACGKNPTEKGDIRTGKKVYRPPITSTYKETEIFEELNNSIEWVLRYYGRPLKQTKDPLPHRDDVMWFCLRTNTKELEKNLKLNV